MHFNSHAHVERDQAVAAQTHLLQNFNSHAHVERDLDEDTQKQLDDFISTHTLTWSVTTATLMIIT